MGLEGFPSWSNDDCRQLDLDKAQQLKVSSQAALYCVVRKEHATCTARATSTPRSHACNESSGQATQLGVSREPTTDTVGTIGPRRQAPPSQRDFGSALLAQKTLPVGSCVMRRV
ncbi:hypothetical protein CLOM_g5071 [Closterium sp. NIES-68]|nr:hypothetical protein CLOM_g5071 [Closterium sp. NIES-68]GJP64525.1 hypothetical protein CLOP_g21501 [Closterium sp. NIES-67]